MYFWLTLASPESGPDVSLQMLGNEGKIYVCFLISSVSLQHTELGHSSPSAKYSIEPDQPMYFQKI